MDAKNDWADVRAERLLEERCPHEENKKKNECVKCLADSFRDLWRGFDRCHLDL